MKVSRNNYIEQLWKLKGNGLVKIVTGMRRAGKSYLLDPLFRDFLKEQGVPEDHIIKIDLDFSGNAQFLDGQVLDQYLRSKITDRRTYYILLDEVQRVDGFVPLLNGLIKLENAEVYVTGSNSRFLSSDIITEFRGRGTEIRVYPFSFAEFMSFYAGERSAGWGAYYKYGGLPIVALETDEEIKERYLAELSKNVYLNDVIDRNKIKNDAELRSLVEVLASSVGSLTNPSKLVRTFKSKLNSSLDDKTAALYLKYLEEAFLIDQAKRFDVKGKKYIDTPLKYYFTDVGIRNSLTGFRQADPGHLMENVIFLELKRRGYQVDVGSVEKREKNLRRQLEIDFIATKGSEKLYVQSALAIDSPEKMEQETRSLLSVDDSFRKIVVLGSDTAGYQDENGIEFMSVFEFLMGRG